MKSQSWIPRISLLWAGLVIGCSFIATPAKFQAASLSLPTALEIGRATFRSLLAAEIVIAVVGVALMVRQRKVQANFLLAILTLAVQWLVVMPFLFARTDAVVQGKVLDSPPWHLVYICLEVVKISFLIAVGFKDTHKA